MGLFGLTKPDDGDIVVVPPAEMVVANILVWKAVLTYVVVSVSVSVDVLVIVQVFVA
jgi:hypothetical protein